MSGTARIPKSWKKGEITLDKLVKTRFMEEVQSETDGAMFGCLHPLSQHLH